MGVEPKYSDGIIEVVCCEAVGGVSGYVLQEGSEKFDVGIGAC